MKLPAIVKGIGGDKFLCINKSDYYDFALEFWNNWDDDFDDLTNITAEYLANTYGEVKSKAHAEFIVKLAEGHGYALTGEVDKSNARTFVIDGESKMLFFMRGSNSFDGSTVKQITIPLPPELNVNTPEEDFEMQQIAKNNDITVNVKNSTDSVVQVTKCEDEKVVHITINEPPKNNAAYTYCDLVQDAERLRKTMEAINKHDSLKNNGDNLIFGDADKCKEWPCVNDEVLINIDFDKYDVKYGKEVNGENGVVRSIFKDGDATVYAVSVDGTCYCFVRGLLSKPKTPEEKERDEIEKYFKELFRVVMSNPLSLITGDADKAIDHIFENLEITKKPQ